MKNLKDNSNVLTINKHSRSKQIRNSIDQYKNREDAVLLNNDEKFICTT